MTSKRQRLVLIAVPLLAAILTLGVRLAWSGQEVRAPVLECSQLLDLGERERGEIVLCHFSVGNSGGQPLILEGFQTSCSCAGVERIVDGRNVSVRLVEVEPGRQVELTARVSVGAPSGERQRVQVIFRTNDPMRPSHIIELIVPRVKGGVYASPKAVVFGTIPIGTPTKQFIELYDTGIHGRKVATARSRHPERFSVRLIPLEKNEPPTRHATAGDLIARLEVVANTEHLGQLDGEIEVALANEKRLPDLISVVGEVAGIAVCRPRQLFLPRRIGDGLAYDGEILLTSRDGAAIRVVTEPLPPELSVALREVPGRKDQALLYVKYKVDATADPHRASKMPVHLRVVVNGQEAHDDVMIVIGENPS